MNESGIRPVEYKVLVLPKQVEEQTKGGLFIPDSAKDKEKFSQAEGVLVAVGAIAFTDPDWLDRPKVGQRILFDKYAGCFVKGNDGQEYRLMNDKEIGAIMEADNE